MKFIPNCSLSLIFIIIVLVTWTYLTLPTGKIVETRVLDDGRGIALELREGGRSLYRIFEGRSAIFYLLDKTDRVVILPISLYASENKNCDYMCDLKVDGNTFEIALSNGGKYIGRF